MTALFAAFLIFTCLVFPGAIVSADMGIDDLLLTPADVPPSCQLISGSHPVRNEAQIFYDYGINSDLLPLVFKKGLQSFKCGREKGMLYYFQYNDTSQREKAEVYARTTLWAGDTQPTADHPEQIFHSGRFLMVLSFKDIQKELLTALLKKIKHTEAAPTSKTP